ncbi:hypothetical protein D3C80_2038980 [compost metagenome]
MTVIGHRQADGQAGSASKVLPPQADIDDAHAVAVADVPIHRQGFPIQARGNIAAAQAFQVDRH